VKKLMPKGKMILNVIGFTCNPIEVIKAANEPIKKLRYLK